MRSILIVALALISLLSCRAEEPSAVSKPVILLTGFEPFGGSSFNTSWDIVSQFEGQVIDGCCIKTAQLKVVYDKIGGPLHEAIEKAKPVAVISFGEGSSQIQIERTAHNGYHPAKPLDNEGKAPPRDTIVPGGAEEIPTGLPVDAIMSSFKSNDIKARTSTNAGGYLCNECFYRLMSDKQAPALRGFIHLPVVPPKDSAMRERLIDAVRIIVKNVIAATK